MSCPPLLGLAHVALRCADLPAMERFYCHALGFRVTWRPDAGSVYLTTGRDNLALHAAPAITDEAGSRLDHVGLLVPEAEDVDRWAAHLATLGVALEDLPRTHRDGARSLYLRDPEGNLVQVLHLPPPPPE